MIYYNNLSAFTEVHYGNTNIDEVYFGNNKVWPEGPAPFGGKWLVTYSDSHTESAVCDSTSSITRNEISLSRAVTLEIGDCVRSIGDNVFHYSIFTGVTIGNNVTSIGSDAFNYNTKLINITIPDGVTNIGNRAFYNCTGLTNVTIGSGVTSIGSASFRYCSSLASITVEATTPPTLGGYVFDDTNNCPIYVPAESVNTYKTTNVWSDYADRIRAIP